MLHDDDNILAPFVPIPKKLVFDLNSQMRQMTETEKKLKIENARLLLEKEYRAVTFLINTASEMLNILTKKSITNITRQEFNEFFTLQVKIKTMIEPKKERIPTLTNAMTKLKNLDPEQDFLHLLHPIFDFLRQVEPYTAKLETLILERERKI